MTRRIVYLALVFALAGPPLTAQVSVNAGAIHARYADAVTGSALFVQPRFDFAGRSLLGSVEGGFTQFVEGAFALRARGDLGKDLPFWRSTRHEMAALAVADLSYLEGGRRSALMTGTLLSGVTMGPVLASANLDLGYVRAVDERRSGLIGFGVGAATELSATALDLRVHRTAATFMSYTDVAFRAERGGGTLSLEGVAGARFFRTSDELWWRVKLAAAAAPGLAVEVVAGAFPRDVTGFERGLFAGVSMRMAIPPGRFHPPRRLRRPVPAAGTLSSGPRVAVMEPVAPGRVRLTIEDTAAARVAIAGQWNEWRPQPMTRAGRGRWTAVLPLLPGAHKFSLVVDGSRWTVPGGVPTLPDGYGRSVGVLLVAGRE